MACVGLLPRVHAPVLDQVGALAEALPAVWTLKGSLSRVHALVLDQVDAPAEALPTFWADGWALDPGCSAGCRVHLLFLEGSFVAGGFERGIRLCHSRAAGRTLDEVLGCLLIEAWHKQPLQLRALRTVQLKCLLIPAFTSWQN